MTWRRLVAACLLVGLPAGLAAQAPAPGPAGWLQAEGYYHGVTEEFGDWRGVALRLRAPAGRSDLWFVDALAQEAFGDRGVYGSLANRHQFGPGWFTLVSVGGGTGDYVLPDLRADFTLGKTWLAGRDLVTMAGVTYVNAKQGFEDLSIFGSLAVYFPGVAIETGARSNWSWPESVQSSRGFGAITLGRERSRLVVFRGSAGREGYQLTGVSETTRRFRSYEGSVSWREWMGKAVGLYLQGDWYDNPFYTRRGVTIGVFRHW